MMNNKKNKKIYIVLTHTGTVLSSVIKFYTRAEFSHVSLSLDEKLLEMYSFGRINPYNPFIGGFVHEGIEKGTFKRFKNTKTEIYSIGLNEKQYKNIKRMIKQFKKRKKIYKFNVIGMFGSAFNLKYRKENYFYCAEFVKYIVEKAKIDLNLPELIKPIDFRYVNNIELEYRGMLRNYRLEVIN